jgi:hypothetical protein
LNICNLQDGCLPRVEAIANCEAFLKQEVLMKNITLIKNNTAKALVFSLLLGLGSSNAFGADNVHFDSSRADRNPQIHQILQRLATFKLEIEADIVRFDGEIATIVLNEIFQWTDIRTHDGCPNLTTLATEYNAFLKKIADLFKKKSDVARQKAEEAERLAKEAKDAEEQAKQEEIAKLQRAEQARCEREAVARRQQEEQERLERETAEIAAVEAEEAAARTTVATEQDVAAAELVAELFANLQNSTVAEETDNRKTVGTELEVVVADLMAQHAADLEAARQATQTRLNAEHAQARAAAGNEESIERAQLAALLNTTAEELGLQAALLALQARQSAGMAALAAEEVDATNVLTLQAAEDLRAAGAKESRRASVEAKTTECDKKLTSEYFNRLQALIVKRSAQRLALAQAKAIAQQASKELLRQAYTKLQSLRGAAQARTVEITALTEEEAGDRTTANANEATAWEKLLQNAGRKTLAANAAEQERKEQEASLKWQGQIDRTQTAANIEAERAHRTGGTDKKHATSPDHTETAKKTEDLRLENLAAANGKRLKAAATQGDLKSTVGQATNFVTFAVEITTAVTAAPGGRIAKMNGARAVETALDNIKLDRTPIVKLTTQQWQEVDENADLTQFKTNLATWTDTGIASKLGTACEAFEIS